MGVCMHLDGVTCDNCQQYVWSRKFPVIESVPYEAVSLRDLRLDKLEEQVAQLRAVIEVLVEDLKTR